MSWVGYARVSTYRQTLDAQLDQLRGAGCTGICREKVTGAHSDLRELLKLLNALTPGDVVTVTRIDRLARKAPLTCLASSSASWTPKRNFVHWPSRGPTPGPAPAG